MQLTGIYSHSPAFTNWSGGFPGLTNRGALLDFDAGGLETVLEYVLGGDPADASDDKSVLPVCTRTASGLELDFRRSKVSHEDADTSIVVEYSSDLSNWNPAVHNTDGVAITVTEDFYGSGIDRVLVNLPDSLTSGKKLFARVKVITP